jgi:two-component system OmpR family sensor kinase
MALAGEPVGLVDVVGQAVADHALVAEAKRVDLGAKHATDDAVVLGDPAALRTLLANLVDNAIRHAREGGRVDVSAGLVGGRPYLEVADDGPGIPEAERGRVFDRFYRRGVASNSGSGLGLAIVKAIADRHAASVSLGDTPGGGLTVRVEFPLRSAQPVAAAGGSAGLHSTAPIEAGRP